MLCNFNDIKEKLKQLETKKLAVVSAEDHEVLAAVRQALDDGLVTPILTGDEPKIRELAKTHNISLEGMEIINKPSPEKAAELCCELIHQKKASAIMKGMIDTSKFMRAILDKDKGLTLGKKSLISHAAAFELTQCNKILILTDAAINIAPKLEEKVKIIDNSVKFAKALGIETPLVACCCAVEKVNPNMQATIDAAVLAKMSDRGQIKDCIIDGPLAFDNAICKDSAKIKKINGPVAGQADIILCNDIESANYLYKSLSTLGKSEAGCVVMGASVPVVLTSRSDTHETKYLSIAVAMLTSHKLAHS
ncbi:MAG: bifunctional enoyl-CoA hydratase/phosphate acetyltransferase [Bacteriovoracaceae bacterium]|nr:bifunctional enoyl-CoA hydratase/phosphate acetyltransferase [Bacteriovoracaceae bacterium]